MFKNVISTLNTAERVVISALVMAGFTYWPSLLIGETSLEPAVLSPLLIVTYGIHTLGLKKLRKACLSPWQYVFSAWAIGSGMGVYLSSDKASIVLDSIQLLIVIVAAVVVSALTQLRLIKIEHILKGWLLVVVTISPLLLAQYLISAGGSTQFIKDAYQVGVFQFPRLHGFSFEPLFLANWMLAPLIYSRVVKNPSQKTTTASVLLEVLLYLTLARGAILAFLAVKIIYGAKNTYQIKHLLVTSAVSFVISMAIVGAAATQNESGFIQGIGRYLDHATLGVFNSAGANNVEPTKTVITENKPIDSTIEPKATTVETFTSLTSKDTEGVVEGSTKGRIESIKVGADIFSSSSQNTMLGVGLFRFGEEANQLKPEIYKGTNLVANSQPIDILTEIGLFGISQLYLFGHLVIKTIKKYDEVALLCLGALSIQYLFFTNYSLLPFWLCLGLLVGSGSAVFYTGNTLDNEEE